MAALSTVCNTVDNMDIEKFIPALVSCIARPSEVSWKEFSPLFFGEKEKPCGKRRRRRRKNKKKAHPLTHTHVRAAPPLCLN